MDIQILDNEASAEYKTSMQEIWRVDYQLSLPNIHLRNAAELAIHILNAHALSIFSGIAEYFPKNLWDLLITQTKMTLNILRQ